MNLTLAPLTDDTKFKNFLFGLKSPIIISFTSSTSSVDSMIIVGVESSSSVSSSSSDISLISFTEVFSF